MIAQIGIAFLGITAIWLSQDENIERRKYACIVGLANQPFWLYATYAAEQWGIFGLCFFYTWAWFKGFKQHWIK